MDMYIKSKNRKTDRKKEPEKLNKHGNDPINE